MQTQKGHPLHNRGRSDPPMEPEAEAKEREILKKKFNKTTPTHFTYNLYHNVTQGLTPSS